jgi:hypothetical protein
MPLYQADQRNSKPAQSNRNNREEGRLGHRDIPAVTGG